jgi:hypothetical protein
VVLLGFPLDLESENESKKCGGWDLNPHHSGDITRKSFFSIFCGRTGKVGCEASFQQAKEIQA